MSTATQWDKCLKFHAAPRPLPVPGPRSLPAPGPVSPAVLIVDDSGYTRKRLRRFLAAEGWERVMEAADGDEALVRYHEDRPTLVLIDQVMRGRAGIDTARLLLERDPGARILMLTVVSDPQLHRRALDAGILRVVNKSDEEALRDALAPERSW
ncbi:MAG: response regulator [bacterium]|nr:response regulator [bacterium]